ncbi:hypothetical protein WJX82_010577 [Trebouxia sp. C0006]
MDTVAARLSCPRFWQPPHSRHLKLPHLQHVPGRGSSFHVVGSLLRNKKQATGYSTLCCCKHREQPSSAGPDISLLRPELQK